MNLESMLSTSKESDECITPFYAVEPLIEFLNPFKELTIWCPFDESWSAYVQLLTEKGFKVIHSHIKDGKDFFSYEPEKWDIIVSNPPFSNKDKILERCYQLGKPFALLMPVKAIQGKKRVSLFKRYGVEILSFDGRIDFHTRGDFIDWKRGNHFGSAYFCYKILPQPLMFKELTKYDRRIK